MTYAKLRWPVLCSIFAALATLALKFSAYYLTGSVGLLSDAVESLVNLLASVTALFCLWFSSQPADLTHTYGHEKIEYFSTGLEGMLILVAAFGIGWVAAERFLTPRPLEELGLGLALTVIAGLLNLGVGWFLLREAKAHHSIVLEADGKHLLTDVWTSAGVLLALVLVRLTGYVWLDPAIALVMAVNITWTAIDLMRRSFDGLMDHALPAREQQIVRSAIEAFMEPGLHYHALRTRQAGAQRFVDFHLLLPGAWTVRAGHDFAEKIEAAVIAALPRANVHIHLEPIEAAESWQDSTLLAQEAPRPGIITPLESKP